MADIFLPISGLTNRGYSFLATNPNFLHVWAMEQAGASPLYKQINNEGDFITTGKSMVWPASLWIDNNGDPWSTNNNKVYKATGAGAFVDTGAPVRNWTCGCCAPNGDIYAGVGNGDVWVAPGGVLPFVSTGADVRDWRCLWAAPNGKIYVSVGFLDVYEYNPITATWRAMGWPAVNWIQGCASPNNDIYVVQLNTNIYYNAAGDSAIVNLNQTVRNWASCASLPNGTVLACTYTNGPAVYSTMADIPQIRLTTLELDPGDIYELDPAYFTIVETRVAGDFVGTKALPITIKSSVPGTPARFSILGTNQIVTYVNFVDVFNTGSKISGLGKIIDGGGNYGINFVPTYPLPAQVMTVADGGDTYGPNGTDYTGTEDAPAIANVRNNDTLRGVTGGLDVEAVEAARNTDPTTVDTTLIDESLTIKLRNVNVTGGLSQSSASSGSYSPSSCSVSSCSDSSRSVASQSNSSDSFSIVVTTGTDSIQAQITKNIKACLKGITVANGYNYDVAMVEESRKLLDISNRWPFILLLENEPEKDDEGLVIRELSYVVWFFSKQDDRVIADPSDASKDVDTEIAYYNRNAIADIAKALNVDIYRGHVDNTSHARAEITEVIHGTHDIYVDETMVMFGTWCAIRVVTNIDATNPYQLRQGV